MKSIALKDLMVPMVGIPWLGRARPCSIRIQWPSKSRMIFPWSIPFPIGTMSYQYPLDRKSFWTIIQRKLIAIQISKSRIPLQRNFWQCQTFGLYHFDQKLPFWKDGHTLKRQSIPGSTNQLLIDRLLNWLVKVHWRIIFHVQINCKRIQIIIKF